MKEVAIFIILLVAISYFINILIINTPLKRFYQLFVRPGIILHEGAHYIACQLMLAEVTQVSFFAKEGGFVKHSSSRFPIIGNTIISLAPIFLGTAAIIFVGQKLGFTTLFKDTQPSLTSLQIFADHFDSTNFWVFIYLVIAIGSTLTPSKQDIKNSFVGIILIIAALYLLRNIAFIVKAGLIASQFLPLVIYPLSLALIIIFLIFLANKLIFHLN